MQISNLSKSLPEKEIYEFGPFCLNAGEHLLLCRGQPVALTPKAFDTLLELVRHHGHVVPKDDLMKAVWPDTFVEESSLTRNISVLRKLLSDTTGEEYIETHPKRGYRFVAHVRTVGDESPALIVERHARATLVTEEEIEEEPAGSVPALSAAGEALPAALPPSFDARIAWRDLHLAAWFPATILALSVFLLLGYGPAGLASRWLGVREGGFFRRPAAPRIQSLVVLPFENLTGDPSQEYFTDGMTDMLLTDLAKFQSLRVISRTSAMHYKGTNRPLPEIARELGVDAVVEGAVTRSGDQVRINVQLIQAGTDQHLWAESFERNLRDVLSLQREMARGIADEVRLKLTPQERMSLAAARAVKPEAQDAYLMGRYFWNKRTEQSLKRGYEYFQLAIQRDPAYAQAYVGLADSYLAFAGYWILAPKEAYPLAKAAASKALEIDGTLAEAHAPLGVIKAEYDVDLTGAEREFRQAALLNPNYAVAHQWYAEDVLAPMGRHEEAIHEMRRARELDPLSLMTRSAAGFVFIFARQYDRALDQEHGALELDPTFPRAHYFCGLAHEQKRMLPQAIEEFKTANTIDPNPLYLSALAHAYGWPARRKRHPTYWMS